MLSTHQENIATDMNDRRIGDSESHAHKRSDDEFARLHQRIDDTEHLVNELIKAKFDSMRLHNEAMGQLKELTEAVQNLVADTKGVVQLDADVTGMLRVMERVNRFCSLLWKPMLFVGVAGGTVYLWLKGLPR